MKLRAAITGDNDSGGVSGVAPRGKRILLMDEPSSLGPSRASRRLFVYPCFEIARRALHTGSLLGNDQPVTGPNSHPKDGKNATNNPGRKNSVAPSVNLRFYRTGENLDSV